MKIDLLSNILFQCELYQLFVKVCAFLAMYYDLTPGSFVGTVSVSRGISALQGLNGEGELISSSV